MSSFVYQQKQAWVNLKKNPGFVAALLSTMGITIGALLCVFTLAYVLLVKPLPYPEQEKLYFVEHDLIDHKGDIDGNAFTYPNLMYLFNKQTQFSDSTLLYYGRDVLTSLSSQPTVNTTFISPKWFDLLNVKMEMGRGFEKTESLATNNPVAILSYDSWQNEFSADPDILNKKVDFSGVSFGIVGVMEQSFIEPALMGTGRKSHVYLPWGFNHVSERDRKAWGNDDGSLVFVGKLTSDKSSHQVEQSLTSLVSDNWQQQTAGEEFFKGWGIGIKLHSFKSYLLGDSADTVYLLLIAVIGLVLIACANIANLFMSRTAQQHRQLAIRAALGATKKHLFSTLFAETGLLMSLSTGFALLIAVGGFNIMQSFLGRRLPRVDELAVNGFTLTAAVCIAVFLAFFFARLGANMINYKALNSTLQSSGKGTGIQVSQKVRKLLITSQVAIVTLLVFVNISLFKDSVSTINKFIGFKTDNITSLSLSYSGAKWPAEEELLPIMAQLRSKLKQLPQVLEVAQSSSPLSGFGIYAMSVVETNERFTPQAKRVDDRYFPMIGQPIIEGDNFSFNDIKDDNYVMIVNDVLAKRLAPEGSAIGTQVSFGGDDTVKVIGVVKGVERPGRNGVSARMYLPSSLSNAQMLIKLKEGQVLTQEQVVNILKEVSSQFTIYRLRPLSERRSQMLFTQYTTAITSSVLAVLTFLLAAIGLYGILSYSTQLRRFELGTRMAIGAKRKDLIGLIIKNNTSAIIKGIFISIALMLIIYLGYSQTLASYLNSQLVVIFMLTLLLISAISFAACYLPLRKIINRPAIYSLRGSE